MLILYKISLVYGNDTPSIIKTYNAVIDTGSTNSFLSNKVVNDLNINLNDGSLIKKTIKGISSTSNGYMKDISFKIENHNKWANFEFICLDHTFSHDIIIGLDLIRHGKLIVDGNSFSFEIKSLL